MLSQVTFACEGSIVLRFSSSTDEAGEGWAFGKVAVRMGDQLAQDALGTCVAEGGRDGGVDGSARRLTILAVLCLALQV